MAETIGSIVDKISIVDLKIYHMQEQVDREDAPADHRERCKQKVEILKIQKQDLTEELTHLSEDILHGKRTLKVYRQFKMYNDPAFKVKKN